jgi:hypothetical protein
MADTDWGTPEKCLEMYSGGFVGSICDKDDANQLMGELPQPLFTFAAHRLRDSGRGQVSLPFRSVLHFDKDAYTEIQTTGDCVSHSTRSAADISRAVEIHAGEQEAWHHRGATEAIYGSRGYSGQGMTCSQAARFVNSQGGLLLRKDYGFADFSEYDSTKGSRWGRRGVPVKVVQEAERHQVGTISLITTTEEARDALANGYGLSVCSSFGFNVYRDREGFCRRDGRWNHAMAWIAVDDASDRRGFLIQNSWGNYVTGPKRHGQPDGSFWIDWKVAGKMINQRGAWAFSNVDGFPPRQLPDYGAIDYL